MFDEAEYDYDQAIPLLIDCERYFERGNPSLLEKFLEYITGNDNYNPNEGEQYKEVFSEMFASHGLKKGSRDLASDLACPILKIVIAAHRAYETIQPIFTIAGYLLPNGNPRILTPDEKNAMSDAFYLLYNVFERYRCLFPFKRYEGENDISKHFYPKDFSENRGIEGTDESNIAIRVWLNNEAQRVIDTLGTLDNSLFKHIEKFYNKINAISIKNALENNAYKGKDICILEVFAWALALMFLSMRFSDPVVLPGTDVTDAYYDMFIIIKESIMRKHGNDISIYKRNGIESDLRGPRPARPGSERVFLPQHRQQITCKKAFIRWDA
jgi:hypothetical protein